MNKTNYVFLCFFTSVALFDIDLCGMTQIQRYTDYDTIMQL